MAGKLNIDNLKMDELIDLKDRVDDRIKDVAKAEMDKLSAKMDRLKPLVGKRGGRGGARGKAPVKYRDPKTGNTWSGRGMTPVWLREHEEAGKKRESFAV